MNRLLFSCDWGTSSFRLRLVDVGSLRVIREIQTDQGADRLRQGSRDSRFRSYLARQVATLHESEGDRADATVWVSGMASSSIGWKELPYAMVPFPLDGTKARVAALGRLSAKHPYPVYLVSGLRTASDVLRGEEVQALGLLSPNERSQHRRRSVLVLPGTHSKHLEIREGQIVDFRTFLTGELFDVLSRHSILRHSLSESFTFDEARTDRTLTEAFRAGVAAGRTEPVLAALFTVRTNHLLCGLSGKHNTAYLSGLLVGSELASLRATDTDTGEGENVAGGSLVPILLAASGQLAWPYQTALDELQLLEPTTVLTPDESALAVARGHALLSSRHGGLT